jgi:hypothetical protein
MSSFYQECNTRINDMGLTAYQYQEVMDIINEYRRLLEAYKLLTKEEIQLELIKRKVVLEREKSSLLRSMADIEQSRRWEEMCSKLI